MNFLLRALVSSNKRGFANLSLVKFNAKKENFILHLRETEFRYNMKNLGQNIYQNLLKLMRKNPIKVS
ncbi:hypothetical protein DMC01_03140 [Campylobacter troglodytis]|nr:hypothetical protein DMC01_03140 [Campylobacter troglodytis]